MAEKKTEMSFEDALKRLEEIVGMLDGGDHPLDESLDLFSEGIKLVKFCNSKIEKVEKSVKKLVNENGELVEKDFSVDGKDEA
ncbi:MAG: exodeoxyribonuclease VII small subunit [Eubacteriales bacterium]